MKRNPIQSFNLETYRAMAEHNGDVLFSWNLQNDEFSATANWFDTFGSMPPSENISEQIMQSKNIHPDDMADLKEYLDTIYFNQHDRSRRNYYDKLFLRMKNVYGRYIPCAVRLLTLFSEQNLPVMIQGMISSLASADMKSYSKKMSTEKDTLTGLNNPTGLQALIEKYLKSEKNHLQQAVITVSLTNLPQLLEELGYLAIDAIIADAAETIRHSFPVGDIIGRLDDNKFLIFSKNVTAQSILLKKILHLQQKLSYSFGEETVYTIDVHAGIALYPVHGLQYATVVENSLQALAFCEQSHSPLCMYNGALSNKLPVMRNNESVHSLDKPFYEHFQEYLFKILASGADTLTIIKLLLGIIGRHFKLSRVFIYELNETQTVYEKTIEWCNSGVEPIIPEFSQLPALESNYLYRKISRNRLIACESMDSLSVEQQQSFARVKVKAFLRSRIVEHGFAQGCVGFDDCSDSRIWTSQEKDAIRFISEILLTFLFNKKAEEKIAQLHKQTEAILDFMDKPMYLVEKTTRRVIFCNKKMSAEHPPLANTGCCYEILYGEEAPCAHCPLTDKAAQNQPLNINWHGSDEVYLMNVHKKNRDD